MDKDSLQTRKNKTSASNAKITKDNDVKVQKSHTGYVASNMHRDSGGYKNLSTSESFDYADRKNENLYEELKQLAEAEMGNRDLKSLTFCSENNSFRQLEYNKMPQNYSFEGIPTGTIPNFIPKTPTTLLGNIRHSNKERHRRERIKNSCVMMRHLLPNETQQSIKLDMATVLELVVQYLSYIQRSIPNYVLIALNESFTQTLINIRNENRKIPPSYVVHQVGTSYTCGPNPTMCIDTSEQHVGIPQPVHLYGPLQYTMASPQTNEVEQENSSVYAPRSSYE